MTDISILGLGSMGSAIADLLLTDGRSVTVWNRSLNKAEPFSARGAYVAQAPETALRASPVSIVVVDSYETIQQWLAPLPSLDGHAIVNVTTGTPAQARVLDDTVRERHGKLLDLALFFYPESVGDPGSSLRASGSRSVWTDHHHTLTSLAGDAVFVGEDVAQANVLDTLWISFYVPALTVAMEGMAYAISNGVTGAEAASVLRTALPVADGFLADAAVRLEAKELQSDNPIELYRASLDTVRATSSDTGFTTLADAACSLLDSIPQGSRMTLDFAAIPALLLERPSANRGPEASKPTHPSATQ